MWRRGRRGPPVHDDLRDAKDAQAGRLDEARIAERLARRRARRRGHSPDGPARARGAVRAPREELPADAVVPVGGLDDEGSEDWWEKIRRVTGRGSKGHTQVLAVNVAVRAEAHGDVLAGPAIPLVGLVHAGAGERLERVDHTDGEPVGRDEHPGLAVHERRAVGHRVERVVREGLALAVGAGHTHVDALAAARGLSGGGAAVRPRILPLGPAQDHLLGAAAGGEEAGGLAHARGDDEVAAFEAGVGAEVDVAPLAVLLEQRLDG